MADTPQLGNLLRVAFQLDEAPHLPVAVLLETAQGLTPDRVADPATALSAATGVAIAALLADLALALGQRRKD